MKPDFERVIVEELESLRPRLIYIFGSHAAGTPRSDSDMDVAFLSQQRHDSYTVFMVAQKAASRLHREVDLIDLARATAVLKAQVVSTGRCIYAESERVRDEFEMYALSDYARANEERKEVLKTARDILSAR